MIRTLALVLAASLAAAMPAPAAAADLSDQLEMIAEQGDGEALYHLGMIAHLGLNGEEKDAAKALMLFRQSAQKGDPLGAYKLGCFYAGQGGDVIEPDPELALKYKLIAAEAGYALAQNDVAQLYFQQGDIRRAIHWLEAAAHQGDASSLLILGGFYSGNYPEPSKDVAKHYAYTLLAAREMELERKIKDQLKAELMGKMGPEEIRRGEDIIMSWRSKPTPLTLKALAGQDAAERLVNAGN